LPASSSARRWSRSASSPAIRYLIIQGGAMIVTQAIVDLTAPKAPARAASEMTIALGEQPRCALFGETFTPGSLVDGFDYGGKYDDDWEVPRHSPGRSQVRTADRLLRQ
jgi:hypothetical protein